MSKTVDILVIKTGGLRGYVQALPAMKAVRAAHRSARITVLTSSELVGLANDTPYIDDVEVIGDVADGRETARVGAEIKKAKFERVYDFDRNPASEKIFQASKLFGPSWIGGGKGMKYCFPDHDAKGMHPTDVALQQLKVAGLTPSVEPIPDVSWAATSRRNAPSLKPEFFGLTTPFVLLAPGSGGDSDAPRWPTARFAGLAARLAANGVAVAIVSDPEDRAEARDVSSAFPGAKDLTSRADVTQVAALATHAGGALGHFDSGVVHLIAAGGATTLSIAPSAEAGDLLGPRGRSVITVNAPDPTRTTVEYAAQMFAMFAHVGSLEALAAHD